MMDYEILTLFPVEEFTDLSHGMTARSTKSKRKIEPTTNHWEDTNQPLNEEKRSPFCTVTIASQQSETPISAPDLETRIRQANELRKTYYSKP
jgi:hypothetical protein